MRPPTNVLYRIRIPSQLLAAASHVLDKLGLTVGDAFKMLLAQVEIQQSLPFNFNPKSDTSISKTPFPVDQTVLVQSFFGKSEFTFTPDKVFNSIPRLLSLARSEFIHSKGDFEGRYLTEVFRVFNEIAQACYGQDFKWSEYNRRQWAKFAESRASGFEGGGCMFSCTANGQYNGEEASRFEGIGLGVPTGTMPYALWVAIATKKPAFLDTLKRLDYSLSVD